ncbi:MAG: cell division inhibitor [Flavobacteriales bacterium]|nr:cell division inhibitor [Flavobacteriales bacterium]|tara:strand:- start:27820 stop:28329 length:510 start_codon:yes stop_codon:yes gene_type:complete
MQSEVKFKSIGKVYRIEAKQFLPISLKEAWLFFSNPRNLSLITPPQMKMKVLSGVDRNIYSGQIIQYSVSPLPFFKTTWVTEILNVEELHSFADEQRFGPYVFWHHKHFFKEVNGGVEILDLVDYVPPFGLLGRLVHPFIIKPKLAEIFKFRENVLAAHFASELKHSEV